MLTITGNVYFRYSIHYQQRAAISVTCHKISQQYNARLHKQRARKMSKLLRLCISAMPQKGLKILFPFRMSPRKHITVSLATCYSQITD